MIRIIELSTTAGRCQERDVMEFDDELHFEKDGPIRRIMWILAGAWIAILGVGAGLGLALGHVIVRAMRGQEPLGSILEAQSSRTTLRCCFHATCLPVSGADAARRCDR